MVFTGKTIAGFAMIVILFCAVGNSQQASGYGTTVADSGDTSILPEPLNESPKLEVRLLPGEEYTTEQLRDKLKNYTRMRSIGNTLLGVGIPMVIGGLTMYISGITLVSDYDDTGVPLMLFGFVFTAVGPELIVAGAVLSKIGGNKKKEYDHRLRLRVGGNGVSLRYDF